MEYDSESISDSDQVSLVSTSSDSSPTLGKGVFAPFGSVPVRRGRTIAVPINGSEVCLKAVRHAIKLILDDADGGRLLLLHAINLCTSPRSPVLLQQLSHDLLRRAMVPEHVPARVVLTFMMHSSEDDKEALAQAICKKAELLGATDLCMVETNGIPHLPIIVGGVAKAVVHNSRIPVTLIKASNKGEKGAENSVRDPGLPTANSGPCLKTFSSRIQGLLTQQQACIT